MNTLEVLSILCGLTCGVGFGYAFLGLCGVWDNGDCEKTIRDLERMNEKFRAGNHEQT